MMHPIPPSPSSTQGTGTHQMQMQRMIQVPKAQFDRTQVAIQQLKRQLAEREDEIRFLKRELLESLALEPVCCAKCDMPLLCSGPAPEPSPAPAAVGCDGGEGGQQPEGPGKGNGSGENGGSESTCSTETDPHKAAILSGEVAGCKYCWSLRSSWGVPRVGHPCMTVKTRRTSHTENLLAEMYPDGHMVPKEAADKGVYLYAFCPRSSDDTTHTPLQRMTTYAQWYDTIKQDLHTHLANTSSKSKTKTKPPKTKTKKPTTTKAAAAAAAPHTHSSPPTGSNESDDKAEEGMSPASLPTAASPCHGGGKKRGASNPPQPEEAERKRGRVDGTPAKDQGNGGKDGEAAEVSLRVTAAPGRFESRIERVKALQATTPNPPKASPAAATTE
ncbi:unnamed protein product [Vitrella brassicaformis CCMP3155]|uniref:Uncharacterized protein n=2 Tax=Vitrella brassicaformis TaxID=1169539 RepID=A0A0G4FIN7_VITBC|nr:unnamed protein product [Vitrella brassicaformis CCMP3155]|eukprot:CEM13156.1 unnamed protein product [Vitrella brassicaformis CCMP3155]